MEKSLDHFAEQFDASVQFGEFRQIEFASIMCGAPIGVRYYLGRLLGRNLFREADHAVSSALVTYMAGVTSQRGAALLAADGYQGWNVAHVVLRHILEMKKWVSRP